MAAAQQNALQQAEAHIEALPDGVRDQVQHIFQLFQNQADLQAQQAAFAQQAAQNAQAAANNAVQQAPAAAVAAAQAAGAGQGQAPGRGGTSIKLWNLEEDTPSAWLNWKAVFVVHQDFNQWDNSTARRMMLMHMKKDAFERISEIPIMATPAAGQADAEDWNLLLEQYERAFISEEASNRAVALYETSRQNEDEDVLRWHTRCLVLFKRAFPNRAAMANTDTTLIRHFIRGLFEKAAINTVFHLQPPTYQEVKGVAERVIAGNAEAEAARSGKLPSVNNLGTGNLACHFCGRQGHVFRDCYGAIEFFRNKAARRGGGGGGRRGVPRGRGSPRGGGRGGAGMRGNRSFPKGKARGNNTHSNKLNSITRSDGLDQEEAPRELRVVGRDDPAGPTGGGESYYSAEQGN